ncbi:MAG: phosphoglycerate dehydrogenase [Elusimicrobia bacterium]|nr:phosphoglycerate dehydrogenase [Elusimicrobiota bacterium]
MANILITTSSFAEEDKTPLDLIKKRGVNAVLNPFGRTLTEEEISKLLKEYDPVGIIAGVEPITKSVLSQSKALKIISRCGVGISNVDLQAAKEKKIAVFNTPDALTESVAELTVGLILNVLRKVSEADRKIRSGKWKKLMGTLLSGKTIGIIGCGRIGAKLADYLQSFGCTVIGHDPQIKNHGKIKMVQLEELIKTADIISLHVPLTDATRRMVNSGFISAMKNSSYIINVARGEIVDEKALFDGLISGKLAGAALDTFEKEPYQGPLTTLENVLLTAHMGSYAKESRIRMELQATQNLLKGLEDLL